MLLNRIEPEFVEFVPDELQPGILYISMEYATASHLCCCGCGEKVVTPFTPTDWRMTYDGETVSLRPSIGNWEQDCRTHYVIDCNRVVEHGPWTRVQVERERARDHSAKTRHYSGKAQFPPVITASSPPTRPKWTPWSRFKAWIAEK
jgi:hypothetical protein